MSPEYFSRESEYFFSFIVLSSGDNVGSRGEFLFYFIKLFLFFIVFLLPVILAVILKLLQKNGKISNKKIILV